MKNVLDFIFWTIVIAGAAFMAYVMMTTPSEGLGEVCAKIVATFFFSIAEVGNLWVHIRERYDIST